MKKPIEILLDRLYEISVSLNTAKKNQCDEETVNELVEQYNQYFFAVQLIQSHTDINYRFTKVYSTPNGYYYRHLNLKKHITGCSIKYYKKLRESYKAIQITNN